MKKVLIIFLALLVVAGAFFGGAVFGSRYQRELYYSVDKEETKSTQDGEKADDEADYITEDEMVDILEDYFNDGDKYDYDEYRDRFSYVNVRDDGRGLAVYSEGAGMHSLLEWWFTTTDGGKTWSVLEKNEFLSAPFDIAYIGDTIYRAQSSTEFNTGWVQTFTNHGKEEGKLVTVEALSGIKDCENTQIVIISENEKDGTLVIGVCPQIDSNKISSDDYMFIGKFDKDLNLLKELNK